MFAHTQYNSPLNKDRKKNDAEKVIKKFFSSKISTDKNRNGK